MALTAGGVAAGSRGTLGFLVLKKLRFLAVELISAITESRSAAVRDLLLLTRSRRAAWLPLCCASAWELCIGMYACSGAASKGEWFICWKLLSHGPGTWDGICRRGAYCKCSQCQHSLQTCQATPNEQICLAHASRLYLVVLGM